MYFILIATRGGKQRYLEGMEAGADDFITKPVDSEELGARIKVAVCVDPLGGAVQSRGLSGLLPEAHPAAAGRALTPPYLDPPPSRTIFFRACTVSVPRGGCSSIG